MKAIYGISLIHLLGIAPYLETGWKALSNKDKINLLKYLESFYSGENWDQWVTIKYEVTKLALRDSESKIRLGALKVIELDEISMSYRLLNYHDDPDSEVSKEVIRIRGTMRTALQKSKLIRQWSRDGIIDYGGTSDRRECTKWKVSDIPDTDLYRELDDGMAGVIFILRNWGINTICSCGHEGYIQCDTEPSHERAIEHALYSANCLPYSLRWIKDRQIDGYSHAFLEIHSPTFEVLEPKRYLAAVSP